MFIEINNKRFYNRQGCYISANLYIEKKQNNKDNISLSIQFFNDILKSELSRKSEVILQFISEVVPQMLNNEFLVQGTVTRLTSELQNEIDELKEKIPFPKEMEQI